MSDPLVIAGREFRSRLFLGTAGYPNRQLMLDALASEPGATKRDLARMLSVKGSDRITLKRRSDPGAPPIPVGGRRNDFFAVALGTILYFVLGFWFHPWVIGIAVFRT